MKSLIIFCLSFLTACSTANNLSQKSGNLNVEIKSNLQADIDVDMSKKIMGKAHHIRVFGFHTQKSLNYADGVSYGVGSSSGGLLSFMGSGMEEEAKSAAAYNAAVSNKADVIVAPQYFVKVKSYVFGLYKEVNAQVWGYSGKITNIRKSKKYQAE